jgi:hypothetical protein
MRFSIIRRAPAAYCATSIVSDCAGNVTESVFPGESDGAATIDAGFAAV